MTCLFSLVSLSCCFLFASYFRALSSYRACRDRGPLRPLFEYDSGDEGVVARWLQFNNPTALSVLLNAHQVSGYVRLCGQISRVVYDDTALAIQREELPLI